MSATATNALRIVVHGAEDDASPVPVLRAAAVLVSERPEQQVLDMTFEYDVLNLRWKGSLYFAQK
ncbi:hypothetical protein ACWGLB_36860 [Streptomyces sp. NPDC055893]|uniref:hypothetical protein n=1 Tax=Streptomyces sp. MBT42 TaxID=1488373 RepID=UPI001E31A2DF|nr:hypothetical protein [Streptomyces sp. MBT42]MCD2469507.1 hypothetical protein [Streptomyces sp. MBT42]